MACNCFQIDNAAIRGTALSRAWIGKGCCTSATALYTWLAGRSPFFYKNGCGGVKNVIGTATLSVHSEGRAFDVSLRNPNDPFQNQFMWDRLNQMVEHGCILGLQRIIFNRRIWDINLGYGVTGPAGWRPFTGAQTHNDHAHVEVCRMSCSRVSADVVNYVLGVHTPAPPVAPGGGSSSSGAGDNSGGGSAVAPPTPPAPVAPAPPVVTSPAPVWVDSTVCGQCGITGFTQEQIVQEEVVAVRLVCGGAGGYCVSKTTGAWCGSGIVRSWGQLTGALVGSVVDIQPYGQDFYALVNLGPNQFIRLVSNGVMTTIPNPDCGAFNGPWSRLTVANNGVILLSNSQDDDGGYQTCGLIVPRLNGSSICC